MRTRKKKTTKRKTKKTTKRKTKKRTTKRKTKVNIPKPNVGDKIRIIIKPYKDNETENGIVKRVLTKRKYHSRGHKVMLTSGTIGRTLRILKRKN